MNKCQITAWVSQKTKKTFEAKAAENGSSVSGLLGLIIAKVIERNPPCQNPVSPTEIRTEKVTVRLTPSTMAILRSFAAERGMKPSSCLFGLLRAQLTKAPYFAEAEMQALRAANRELSAIGRNVNQIARALNTSLDNADLTRARELDEIRIEVNRHRNYVRALIRANLDSWGVHHEEA